jgi:uncharacterized protein (DUF3084 family)
VYALSAEWNRLKGEIQSKDAEIQSKDAEIQSKDAEIQDYKDSIRVLVENLERTMPLADAMVDLKKFADDHRHGFAFQVSSYLRKVFQDLWGDF